jgi:hypothetical protein
MAVNNKVTQRKWVDDEERKAAKETTTFFA